MGDTTAWFNRLLTGRPLRDAHLAQVSESLTLPQAAALAQAMVELHGARGRAVVARALFSIARCRPQAAWWSEPSVSPWLIQALTPNRRDTSGMGPSSRDVGDVCAVADHLVRNTSTLLLAPLRAVVMGAVLPVIAATWFEETRYFGAKVTGLDVMAVALTADCRPGLLRVFGDDYEPQAVRDRAAACLLALGRPDDAEPVARYALRAGGRMVSVPATRLAAARRALLLPWVQTAFSTSGDYGRLTQAANLLAWIGGPAVPFLTDVMLHDEHGRSADAESLLHAIDPQAVYAARRRAELESRALSPARPAANEPDRGLSRSEP